jgi:hypothetical protein
VNVDMAEYDSWFFSKLTDLMNAVLKNDYQSIIDAFNEVQRGIEYANNSPGAIQDLLVRMGQGLVGPVIVQYKLEKKDTFPKEKIELDELKTVLKQKRQDKVVNKMTGSLTSLMDVEDEES